MHFVIKRFFSIQADAKVDRKRYQISWEVNCENLTENEILFRPMVT